MDSMIGKTGLIIYKDEGKNVTCFGQILDIDELFFKIETEDNTLLIPKSEIRKVKIKGEKNERDKK